MLGVQRTAYAKLVFNFDDIVYIIMSQGMQYRYTTCFSAAEGISTVFTFSQGHEPGITPEDLYLFCIFDFHMVPF